MSVSPDQTVCSKIAEIALKHPNRIAALCSQHSLTYGELEKQSSQLAHYLQSCCDVDESIIGLYQDRSLDLIVSMLAILKSGRAYLPLDPRYPKHRIQAMLQQAQVKRVVTHSKLDQDFANTAIETINTDQKAAAIKGQSIEPVAVTTSPQDLAYVIFTSGSTGKPKGVMIRHIGLINLLLSMQQTPGIKPQDHMLALTTIAFDISGLEIWLPLISGATLTMATFNAIKHPPRLAQLINESNITMLQATPTTLQMLLYAHWQPKAALKILCGGEALPKNLADALLSMGHELWNVYGPTETTIWSTVAPVLSSEHITVGKPIANTQAFLFDEHMDPVPLHSAGCLYISGIGLAAGYIHQPELTKAAFIPHPSNPTLTLYKTGDLARILSNGEIEILGRLDDQVKINGHRIELQEVEHQLNESGIVQEAVVLAIPTQDNEKALTAYVRLDAEKLKKKVPQDIESERVHYWGWVYSDVYKRNANSPLDFNTSGWNSSYSKKAIPPLEMKEWISHTVERIRSLNPRRILEIGCGTGLLLAELAPAAEAYAGVDISAEALLNVKQLIQSRDDLNHVQLHVSSMDKLMQLELGQFDLIVINSVIQYFPSADYLLDGLRQVLTLLVHPGKIFIGDVRDMTSLPGFHASLIRHQAEKDLQVKAFKDQLMFSCLDEEELVLSPKFFTSLTRHFPEIDDADILLKTGSTHNELNCFRYDVILSLNNPQEMVECPQPLWYCAQDLNLSKSACIQLLQSQPNSILGISHIPNSRLTPTNQLLHWLNEQEDHKLLQEFRGWKIQDMDPVELLEVATQVGLEVKLSWHNAYADGAFDAIFYPKHLSCGRFAQSMGQIMLSPLANNPLLKELHIHAQSLLRNHLLDLLPVYMVPVHFIFLQEFPRTPNQKVDKKALPKPNHKQSFTRKYTPPSSPLENQLAKAWEQVFSLPKIGVTDNFFSLGGDSIRSMQIAAILHQEGLFIEAHWVFTAPTIAEFAAFMTQQEHKIAAFEKRAPFVLSPLNYAKRLAFQQQFPELEDIYPLSPMQLGILYGSLKIDGSYLIQGVFTLVGTIHPQGLLEAWQQVVQNNPILRTGFRWEEEDQPFQYVLSSCTLPFTTYDWTAYDEQEQQSRLKTLLQSIAKARIGIHEPPLFCINLIKCQTDRYECVFTCQHLIVDGWSLTLIMREVVQAYAQKNTSAVQSTPYREYIGWLAKQDFEKAKTFWQQYLQGFQEPSRFQFQQIPPQATSYSSHRIRVHESITAHMLQFAKRHLVTVNTLIQVAWGLVLGRYTQKQDVVFGITVSGRSIGSEIAQIIGPCIQTMPVRILLNGLKTVEQLLLECQQQRQKLLEHGYVGLATIQANSSIAKQSPLFDSLMVFEQDAFDLKAISDPASFIIEKIQWHEQTEYPLTLSVQLAQDLTFDFAYKTSHFGQEDIKHLADNLLAALDCVCNNPWNPINQCQLLSPIQYQTLVYTWNQTACSNQDYICAHQLFENQVRATPDAIALIYETQQWTYDEINQKANQLAHWLLQETQHTSCLIAIAADRSYELVIGLLAILKAGSTYVILDPSYPLDRLNFILKDSQAPIVLSTQKYPLALEFHGQRLAIDDLDAALPSSNPGIQVSSATTAYLMYTSGSTGQPKGVLNSHRAILNRLLWTLRAYPIASSDVFLQLAAVGFDISFWEMLFPLSAGASLCVAPTDKHKDIEYIAKTIHEQHISVLHFVPSLLELFLEYADVSQCQSIRQVVCGGELVTHALRDKFFAKLSAKLYHAYGPTEAAISVTHLDCEEDVCPNLVPIGKPIANTQLYILNQHLQPMPVNTLGELYISGVCLADGYLHREDLSAQSFVANPFKPGETMYKTGDLAYYLADGHIVFMGRKDNQVKLYGHRIELGEIESHLRKQEDVRDALVLVREDIPQHPYLVAYILTNLTKTQPLVSKLRTVLENNLPDYMVPGAFECLRSWPLTTNGKIDKKTLPRPSRHLATAHAQTKNLSSEEQVLAAIWCKLFGLTAVDVEDDFFRLGGDSILCIQLISLARKANLYFSIKDVFRAPTIAGLAALATPEKSSKTSTSSHREQDFPLTPIQRHFFNLNLNNPNHFNQNLCLEINSDVCVNTLKAVLLFLRQHHHMLRARFTQSSQQIQDGPFSFETVSIESLSKAQQTQFIHDQINQAQTKIQLEQQVFLALHFHCGEGQASKLCLIAHHLCMDTVSWNILVDDLDLLLEQYAKQLSLSLPEAGSPYRDWSSALMAYATSSECKQELTYWQAIQPAVVQDLPSDHRVLDNCIATMKTIQARLALTDAKQLHNAQIPVLLFTALSQAYCQWASQSSFFVNCEGHGREEIDASIDTSRTLGWFTSLYPVHIQLDCPKDVVRSLQQVKQCLHSIPKKGIGFALLASDLKEYPQPKMCINYHGKKSSTAQAFKHFKMLTAESIQAQARENQREYELEMEIVLEDNSPGLEISYNALQFDDHSIVQFIEALQNHYSSCIDYCSQNKIPFVPSDFPLCRMDQSTLNAICAHRWIENLYPLTPLQAGILFQTQLQAVEDVYFVQSVYLLEGEVDLGNLRQAWQAVVQHHPILRTGFIWQEVAVPLQFVLQAAELPWEVLDWSQHGLDEGQLQDYLQDQRRHPFSLNKPPLCRLTLIRLSQQRFYMIWTQHHILVDGWCLSILLNDVLRAYQCLAESSKIKLPTYPAFAEYLAWLQQQDLKPAQAFWKDYLSGFSNPSRLTLKLGVNPSVAADYGQHEAFLSLEETQSILQFIKIHGITLNTFLQCAWGILLSFYLDTQDVVFGVTQSGRSIDLPLVEAVVGLLINTLPLRVRFDAQDTVLSLLRRLQEDMSDLYQYSYTPLADIPQWAGLNAREKWVDTVFVFENYPVDETALGQFKPFQMKPHLWLEKTEYPLTITILPKDTLGFVLAYQTQHFDEAACADIAKRLSLTLRHMVNAPSKTIQDFPKLEDTELQCILADNQQSAMDYPKHQCLHELFEQQVASSLQAIAVVDEEHSLSYQALNAKANQLAHQILSLNLPKQALVALCLDRSIHTVVALLAVMKAGAAYVPIDPDLPTERVSMILEEISTPLLITQLEHRSKFRALQTMICLDEGDSSFPVTNPNALCSPRQPLYAIFTSGSTGKPKGVLISHQNVVNFLSDMHLRLQISAKDTWLSVTRITFDIAGLEIYLPLITGARLILANRLTIQDADLLKTRIQSSGCTLMQATPATWRMLVDANWSRPKNLQILAGGEALPLELVHALNPNEQDFLWNLYGPTETTIWSMAAKLIGKVSRVHLGHPIANTRIYLLDKFSRLTPQGMPGEICIAGDGLSLGYLNQPQMTASRFLEIPLGTGVETVYKTGDIGRFAVDGTLEYLGRSDDQIKRHGYRIELGDISACLMKHPHIKEALVLPYQVNQEQYLAAHLTTKESLQPTTLDFSLFYFSAYQAENPYELLLESVKYADAAGFKAVWTPERHFHEVGGQFPNPSVLSAAMATITQRLHLRAGSVVLPLHHPVRVAEEWSLVDNLSNGRVGLALASGWNPKDFAFFPDHYAKRKEVLQSHLQQLQALWQGNSIEVLDGQGKPSQVRIYPRPKQAVLPIWITAAGNPDTFMEAGKMGANLLTHLLGQSIESLAEKIALYRQSLQDHGFDPKQGVVSIMLHAFVSESTEKAVEISKKPFCNYLKGHISLESMAQSVGRSHLVATEEDEDELIALAFERYSKTSALIGSVAECALIVKQLQQIGVNEIACLVDFGVDAPTILEHLPFLTQLMQHAKQFIALDEDSLRLHLDQHLPQYMHPNAFIAHKEFPLTFNGKINRKLLASHHQHTLQTKAIHQAPSTEMELRLVQIWSEVLNKPVASIHDNFFHLGGHSLLVTQAISRIRREFGLEIPLRALFDAPTIAEFSKALLAATQQLKPLEIAKTPESTAYPLSFSQRRSWYLHQLLPDTPLHNTLFMLRMQGDFRVERVQTALSLLIKRHAMLRMTLSVRDGMPEQVIHDDLKLRLCESNWILLDAQEKEQALLELQRNELYLPFDLAAGPLLRGQVIEFANKEWVLLITQHHIITDGWSRQVFIRDLTRIYNALIENKSADLPALDLQYVDFAVWQAALLKQPLYLRQLDYWKKQLADLPQPLDLPYAKGFSLEPDHQGKSHVHSFDLETSKQLKAYANQQEVTLFMLMLSLFGLLLHRYSGQDDLILRHPDREPTLPRSGKHTGLFCQHLGFAHSNQGQSFVSGSVAASENHTAQCL